MHAGEKDRGRRGQWGFRVSAWSARGGGGGFASGWHFRGVCERHPKCCPRLPDVPKGIGLMELPGRELVESPQREEQARELAMQCALPRDAFRPNHPEIV